MTRVLIIEDERRVAELLKRGLQESAYFVSVAENSTDALKLIREQSFAIVISDVLLPDGSGFDLCQKIRLIDPDVPIVMLTALGATDDKLAGFNSGADDYMVKPFDFRELKARIEVLLKRKTNNTSQKNNPYIQYADLRINVESKSVSRSDISISLTPKEYNLLMLFVQNPEKVLSRSQIASAVWNTHFDTGTNFIDVYVNYLRKKIDKPFHPKLIHTKPGMGFIFTDKP